MTEADESYVLPRPASPTSTPLATLFRSTWVTTSIQGLRKRGFYDAYAANLDPADRDAITFCSPASWLPTDLVLRHYQACDKLALSNDTLLDIGADVTQRVHATALALGKNVVDASGLTPWTILGRIDKLWARAVVGGTVAVAKLGPKEARIEIYGFPVSKLRYNRIATRGICRGLVQFFCKTVWSHEVISLCTDTSLGYRVQWA